MRDRILNRWTGPGNRLVIAYILFGLMVTLGAVPGEAQALSARFGDKLLHFVAYAGLSALLFSGSRGTPWQRAGHALLLICALGALDECIQGIMPYRSADLQDWAWDMLAANWAVASMLALDSIGIRFGGELPDAVPR